MPGCSAQDVSPPHAFRGPGWTGIFTFLQFVLSLNESLGDAVIGESGTLALGAP